MEVLKQSGYKKYDPPVTKAADELWQKEVDACGKELVINGWYYSARGHRKPKPTVEFQIQNDEIQNTMNLKLFGFAAENLSGRKLEKIEGKLRNLFVFSFYA